MAVTLTGTGGLFTRLGKLFGMAKDIRTHMADLTTETDDVLDQYEGARDLSVGLQESLESFRGSASTPQGTIQTIAERTVIEMVHADDPLPRKSLNDALDRLFDQMTANADDVDGTTVSSATAAGREDGSSNVGDGQVVVSLTNRDGDRLMTVRAEDILLTCSSDAQIAGTAGRETFLVEGEAEEPDRFSETWPGGSGIFSSITVNDPSIDASSGGQNILTNSDFEDFTANAPDDWTIDVGSAGTTVDDETTNFYRGAKALKIIGNGSQLTAISQAIALGVLKPRTKYCFGFWTRRAGGAIAGGVGRLSVKDSGGTIVTGASDSITLTGLTTSYAFRSVVFQTGEDIDTSYKFVIELTTALTNTSEWLIDDLALVEMIQFGGAGGPYIALWPGAEPFVIGDRFKITITNNNEGEFVRELDRFFDLHNSGLVVPSVTDTSETIADSLIS